MLLKRQSIYLGTNDISFGLRAGEILWTEVIRCDHHSLEYLQENHSKPHRDKGFIFQKDTVQNSSVLKHSMALVNNATL